MVQFGSPLSAPRQVAPRQINQWIPTPLDNKIWVLCVPVPMWVRMYSHANLAGPCCSYAQRTPPIFRRPGRRKNLHAWRVHVAG